MATPRDSGGGRKPGAKPKVKRKGVFVKPIAAPDFGLQRAAHQTAKAINKLPPAAAGHERKRPLLKANARQIRAEMKAENKAEGKYIKIGGVTFHPRSLLGAGAEEASKARSEGRPYKRLKFAGSGDSVAAPGLKLIGLSAKPAEYAGEKVEAGLKKAGAPKGVQTAGRLVTEFGFPTNFVSLGYGAGKKVLEKEAAKAAAAGKTKKAASYTRAAEKNRRGISAGVRFHVPLTQVTRDFKTSGKTTARLMGRLPEFRKGSIKLGKHRVSASQIGQEIIHDFRPGHLDETQHTDIRRATRERRAAVANADRTAVKVSRARDKVIGDEGTALENAMERAPKSVQAQQALVKADRLRRGRAKAVVRLKRKVGEGPRPVAIGPRTRDEARLETARIRAREAQTDYEAKLAAMERHNPSDLSPELRAVAEHSRKGFQTTLSEMERRGISPGKFKASGPEDAQRFVPHVHQTKLETDTAEKAFKPKPRQGVAQAHRRKIRQPLNVSSEMAPETFVHGKPVQSFAQYERSKAEDIANHDFWQKVAKTGRKYDASSSVDTAAGERVYRVENRKGLVALEEWTGKHDTDLANAALHDKKYTYVVLNRNTVEKVKRDLRMPGTGEGDTALGRGLDRMIGGWKTAVTVYNPSYHARNLIGDTINARLADTHTQAFRQSSKVMGALHQRETFRSSPESLLGGAPPKALDKTIKIRNYGETTLGDIIGHAERLGVIRTGQHGAEVRELLGGSAARAGRLRAFSEYREDLPRMATFLAALSRGKTLEEAADWSLKHHFDYADLTQVERRLRRLFPFYTFWARNTRLQAEKFLTRPGKYARFGVALDELARLAGFEDYGDYASQNLGNAQQRGMPIPIRWNGRVRSIFLGFTQTDLNNLDTNPDQAFDNVAQRVTFLKLIAELHYNKSAFFRSDIEDPKKPLVPAPFWVKPLQHTPIGKFLGVHTYVDRRSGKRILGWRAKADYTFRSLSPQTNTAVQIATGTTGSRNMNAQQQALAFLTGIKITNPDPATVKINNLYKRRNDLDNRRGALQQRLGKDLTGHYRKTKETIRLGQEIDRLDQQIGRLRVKRGDPSEELPAGQRPKVGRAGSLLSQSRGPSVEDILGHSGPTVNDILGQ